MSDPRLMSIMSGANRSLSARVLRPWLGAAARGYATAIRGRNAVYQRGLRRIHDLPRPVVSVGNLTAGGTGKTPMVLELARRLSRRGHVPGVLLRGFGGDEHHELADARGHACVQPNPDRQAGAAALLGRTPAITCFLLDDGFQHRRVRRDLDVVLIDATRPFGHGWMLPRGLLREPVTGLQRADAVILTRTDQVGRDDLTRLDEQVSQWHGNPPIAHVGSGWNTLREGERNERPVADLATRRVMGVCGVGNPVSFETALRDASRQVIGCERFADHHHYSSAEVAALLRQAAEAGAEAVVTTEKDWVKWRSLLAERECPVPVLRPGLMVRWFTGAEAVDQLLASRLGPGG